MLFEVDDIDLQKIVAVYNDYIIDTEKMKQITKESQAKAKTSTQMSATGATPKKVGGGCWRCGHTHPQGKCPAWGSKCAKCEDINHFTHCCKGTKHIFKANDKQVIY